MDTVIYKQENNKVAVMSFVLGTLGRDDISNDVPAGAPYIIIDKNELPSSPQDFWIVDFSNPDGIGCRI